MYPNLVYPPYKDVFTCIFFFIIKAGYALLFHSVLILNITALNPLFTFTLFCQGYTNIYLAVLSSLGLPGGATANAGNIRDTCLIPGSERFAGGGHGNPSQSSSIK